METGTMSGLPPIRIAATMYDRTRLNYAPGTETTRATYEATPLYMSASGAFAVLGERHRVFDVYHVATGLRVPSYARDASGNRWVMPGVDARSASGGFRTKTAARRFMEAVEATGLIPPDRMPTSDELRPLQAWMIQHAREATA